MVESTISRLLTEATNLLRKHGTKVLTNPIEVYRENSNTKAHKRTISILESLDYSTGDLIKNEEVMRQFSKMKNVKVETINWFIPVFTHTFGGIYTILRFANYFRSKRGIENRFIICGETQASTAEIKEEIANAFPGLSDETVLFLRDNSKIDLPDSDISIATFWRTAYSLLKFNKTKGKFYFIQDYEPLFYPAGAIYAAAEMTYRFGYYGITNTVGLFEFYKKEYGGVVQYFTPSVDQKLFFTQKKKLEKPSIEKPFKIFFYARPETSRNAFELGVSAIGRLVKKHGKSVMVYAAGSNWNPKDYGLGNNIVMLGIMPYKETAMLYRQCDLGLVFMFTKHPSYLPLELMASGCVVLTNYNSATEWFLKDGKNCALAYPSISSVVEKTEQVMGNLDLRQHIIEGGFESVRNRTWTEEIEKIYRFITNSERH